MPVTKTTPPTSSIACWDKVLDRERGSDMDNARDRTDTTDTAVHFLPLHSGTWSSLQFSAYEVCVWYGLCMVYVAVLVFSVCLCMCVCA